MPKLVYCILYIVYWKSLFLIFAFLLSLYILHTTYYIPPAFAAIRDFPDCETVTQTPVTANVAPHETYLDIVSNAIIYPGVNQEIKDNLQKDKTVCAGISQENWLATVLNFTCSLFPIKGFCPQALSLGKNTVEFDSKTSTFKDANIYPNLNYAKQSSNDTVIKDTAPNEKGDQVISDVADRAGLNYGNYYSTEYPREVYIEGNSAPVKLGDKLDNSAALTQRDEIEKERTGQLTPSMCLYFSGTFYPGIQPDAFKDIDCSGVVPEIP